MPCLHYIWRRATRTLRAALHSILRHELRQPSDPAAIFGMSWQATYSVGAMAQDVRELLGLRG